jgi:hypothetical protein
VTVAVVLDLASAIMDLKAIRHLWGLEEIPVATALRDAAAAGYAGVEAAIPPPSERDALREHLSDTRLEFIPEIILGERTPATQLVEFEREMRAASTFDAPFVVAQSGRDDWPLEEAINFYRHALELEAEIGLPVAHETHRGRPLFTPWTTTTVLSAVPDLRLCCDFSHWVVVAERLLDEHREAIELAARHALHVHTRIGYEEGPQVPDPSAAEFAAHRARFECWWQKIWKAQSAAGFRTSTFTPEYGPPPYLQTMPHSRMPVADLPAICDAEADRVRKLFAAWQAEYMTS